MARDIEIKPYWGPVGGWGSAKSVTEILLREAVPLKGPFALWHQNKPRRFCLRELLLREAGPSEALRVLRERRQGHGVGDHRQALHARISLPAHAAELETWSDHDSGGAGRLTHPMRWDAATDKYVPIDWAEAFAAIGARAQGARSEIGRLLHLGPRLARSLLHVPAAGAHVRQQQSARQLEHVPREHVRGAARDDRRAGRHREARGLSSRPTASSSSARTSASTARACCISCRARGKRGVPIITFNPLRERGLERFTNPQSPVRDADADRNADQHAVSSAQSGGDLAALVGMCKALIDHGRCRQRQRRRPRPRCRFHRRAHQRLRGIRRRDAAVSSGATSKRARA